MPAAPAATAFMVRRCVASWLLKASDVMTSHDTVRRADRARQSSPALPAGTGAVTQVARPRLGPLHEGRVLLGRVRGYFMRCGGSCSTHSPWPVHPRPRAVRRPEEGSGQGQVEPAPPGPEQVSRQAGPGASGSAARPRTRSRARLGVHAADISGLTVDASDRNPWNSAIPSRPTASGRY